MPEVTQAKKRGTEEGENAEGAANKGISSFLGNLFKPKQSAEEAAKAAEEKAKAAAAAAEATAREAASAAEKLAQAKAKAAADAAAKAASAAAAVTSSMAPPSSVAAMGAELRYYTVKSGDSLSKIAKQFYGDASKWTQIYEANKLVIGDNPNLIKPDQRLRIP